MLSTLPRVACSTSTEYPWHACRHTSLAGHCVHVVYTVQMFVITPPTGRWHMVDYTVHMFATTPPTWVILHMVSVLH